MALPVLDGNQSATTLSSVVTGGEHIVAHSVVSLGATAISNINSAVSGTAVTIPGLARLGNSIASDNTADANLDFIKIGGHQDGQNQVAHIVHVSAGGAMKVDASGSSVTFSQASVTFGAITGSASILNFPSTQTVAGTVTANLDSNNFNGALTSYVDAVSSHNAFPVEIAYQPSVTIGSLPAISGTVTANGYDGANDTYAPIPLNDGASAVMVRIDETNGNLPISGTVTANVGGDFAGAIEPVFDISNVSHKVAVQLYDDGGSAIGIPNNPLPILNPSGALTTRFGSVVTANLSQITSAVTNFSRKYLLAQNISAGTVTIGIGFSPTTTQGIQLTAGGGLTFDAFCPTGAVYWLGAVTGAAFTILEG
jgi:hypothetical protein